MDGTDRQRLLDPVLAALSGGAAFVLYVMTLAPTVLAGDGGEFQFVPYLLGVAHPTGYPLYCLLGWAWSRLLVVGDVAFRMNLFSAFWAALSVALVYLTSHAFLRQALPGLSRALHRLLAALAATTFAVTPTFWSQAVIAEVYSLHIFLVLVVLYLLLAYAARRTPGPLLLAACGLGLSLAHHRTSLLLIPAILAYLWLTDRSLFRNGRLILKALLLLLLPLALYLYIPLRAPHTPYLHLPLTADRDLVLYDNTLPGLIDFALGGPFGGSVDLSVDLGARLAMAWGFLRDEVGWIGLALALVGAVGLAAIGPSMGAKQGRRALLTLSGLIYVTTVAFDLVYTIGDIFVLFIPSYLVVVFWLALGVGVLVHVGRRLLGRWRLASTLAVLPFFVLPLWLGVTRYADLDQSRNTGARARWEAILTEPLPSGAVLVSNDRNDIMPMWYLQYVDGRRPDLLGLFPLVTAEYPTLGHVLDLALDTGRPAYLVKEMPGVEVKVDVEARGSLWHVLGPAVDGEPAYPGDHRLAEVLALAGYDRVPRSPRPGEALQVRLYWQPLGPMDAGYHSFVHLLDGAGHKVAQSDRQPGGVFYPTTLWRSGERLRDDHLLTIPADAPAGVYRLLVGMYAPTAGGALEPLGEPVVVGQVAVKHDVPTRPAPAGHPAGVQFAGLIELLGYDAAQQEGMLAVTLHWRCVEPPHADYTVFVHLLDAAGEIVAQRDGQPQGGTYPTSVWDVDEVVGDEHRLALPPDLPPGNYRLRVGLYTLETGARLGVVGGGDSAELELRIGD